MEITRRAFGLMTLLAAAQLAAATADHVAAGGAVRAAVGANGSQHIAILGGSYFFKPDHIIVKVNVPVELSLRREWGIVPHTFVLKMRDSGVDIDEDLSTASKTVTFTPRTVGRFEFYCRNKFLFFRSHKEKGMKGILEVVG